MKKKVVKTGTVKITQAQADAAVLGFMRHVYSRKFIDRFRLAWRIIRKK